MLSGKQSAFVNEYLKDLNATQAAIRSGYSERTACVIGHENLRKPNIKEAIEKARGDKAKRNELTADRVIQGLLLEAENCAEGSSHGARVAAWAHLGKHLGMFVDRVEATGTVHVISGVPLTEAEWAAKHGADAGDGDGE